MHRARRAPALAALAVTALALVSGCSATNPQTTTLEYDPADGQDVAVGPVDVDSLLIVSKEGTNGPGTLVARLTNTSGTARTVSIKGTGFDASFDVPAKGAIAVGPHEEHSASIPTVGAKPGGIVSLTVAGEDGTTHSVQVPVLTGTQPEFATLVPTPTPTPTYVAPPPAPSTSSRSGSSSRSSSPASTVTPSQSTSTRGETPTPSASSSAPQTYRSTASSSSSSKG